MYVTPFPILSRNNRARKRSHVSDNCKTITYTNMADRQHVHSEVLTKVRSVISKASTGTDTGICAACAKSPAHLQHSVLVCTGPAIALPKTSRIKHTENTQSVATKQETGLTEMSLAQNQMLYDDASAQFAQEIRMRSLQEAGIQLGFNMKLGCYEKDPSQLTAWLHNTGILHKDRAVLKDASDKKLMNIILRSVDVALTE